MKKYFILPVICCTLILVGGWCGLKTPPGGENGGLFSGKGNLSNLADMSEEEIAEKIDKAVAEIKKRENWEFARSTGIQEEYMTNDKKQRMRDWYLGAKKGEGELTRDFIVRLFYGDSRQAMIEQLGDGKFESQCVEGEGVMRPVGPDEKYQACGTRRGDWVCEAYFYDSGFMINVLYAYVPDTTYLDTYSCTWYISEFLDVFDKV